MTINLRIADLRRESDAAATLRLLNEYASGLMGGGEALPSYTQENLIGELLQRNNWVVLHACTGEQAVGLAICYEGFSTFAAKPIFNVHDFAVSPAFQGQGIAKKLLSKVETIARDRGCCKLTLEVLEGNQIAQKLYQQFGFAGYELDPKMGRAMYYQKLL